MPADKVGLTDAAEDYQRAEKPSVAEVVEVVKEEQAKPTENLTPTQRVKKGIAFLI